MKVYDLKCYFVCEVNLCFRTSWNRINPCHLILSFRLVRSKKARISVLTTPSTLSDPC